MGNLKESSDVEYIQFSDLVEFVWNSRRWICLLSAVATLVSFLYIKFVIRPAYRIEIPALLKSGSAGTSAQVVENFNSFAHTESIAGQIFQVLQSSSAAKLGLESCGIGSESAFIEAYMDLDKPVYRPRMEWRSDFQRFIVVIRMRDLQSYAETINSIQTVLGEKVIQANSARLKDADLNKPKFDSNQFERDHGETAYFALVKQKAHERNQVFAQIFDIEYELLSMIPKTNDLLGGQLTRKPTQESSNDLDLALRLLSILRQSGKISDARSNEIVKRHAVLIAKLELIEKSFEGPLRDAEYSIDSETFGATERAIDNALIPQFEIAKVMGKNATIQFEVKLWKVLISSAFAGGLLGLIVASFQRRLKVEATKQIT